MSAGFPRVRALLGPTNTGKTYRAVQAMLAHRSGMIGLPLRLLAREVYDRIAAEKGADTVALVTGEEKRIPSDPRWFVCTVEAMPLDRRVAFLAIDEVQLAGDRSRGHTFTDRILHARGTFETWFLGAETIQPLLLKLIPEIEIDTAPRLSQLTYAGERKLTSLPSRSAIVAFSADQVYAHAERLRATYGGAAVVLGALSPRTRNAQVSLYQSGEVGHLVATDAIGMGLNMDVEHVAFTGMRKFDGHGFRDLADAELGQIAGRAGRYKTDGTFGTTAGAGPIDPGSVEAIQRHVFPALERLYWRNSRLDFSAPAALLDTLNRPPPQDFLSPCRHEDDQTALEDLLAQDPIRRLLTTPESLERLWEVCQIPDYRKDLTGAHAKLLAHIAAFRMAEAAIPAVFIEERLSRLDRLDGDIDTLMSRIAWIRTWTFVCHQRQWTENPQALQERARSIEDQLSDALHLRLTERFVDRRMLLVVADSEQLGEQLTIDEDDFVQAGELDLGHIEDLSFIPNSSITSKRVLARIRKALGSEALARVCELEGADDNALTVDHRGRICAFDQCWGRLLPGPTMTEPKLATQRLDLLDAAARDRVRTRLTQWLGRWVEQLFAPITRGNAKHLGPAGKGVVHQLREGMGAVDAEALVTLKLLTDDDRKHLARLDVRLGTQTAYVQTLLRGPALEKKSILWSIHHGKRPLVPPPPNGPTSVAHGSCDADLLQTLGFRRLGERWARVDMIERVLAQARKWSKPPRTVDPAPILGWLGCSHVDAVEALRELGFRVRAEGPTSVHIQRVPKRSHR